MANPNPTPPPADKTWKPGQSGNPNGRPKGIKSFANVVRQLLADDTILDKLTNAKSQKFVDSLPTKNPAFAVVAAMVVKALEGDAHAADWLRKTGFGDKLDITSDGAALPVPILGGASMAIVNAKPKKTAPPASVKPKAPTVAPNVAMKPVAKPVAQPGTKPARPNPLEVAKFVATNGGKPVDDTQHKPAQPAKPQAPRTVDTPKPQQPPKLTPAQLETQRIIASAIVPPTNGK